jgi:predicted transcriptional regulator
LGYFITIIRGGFARRNKIFIFVNQLKLPIRKSTISNETYAVPCMI